MTASVDMKYYGRLDREYTSIAFDTEYGEFYTANQKNYIQTYDYVTMEPLDQISTYGNIQKMFYNQQDDTLLIFSTVKLGSSSVAFTGIEKVYYDVEM